MIAVMIYKGPMGQQTCYAPTYQHDFEGQRSFLREMKKKDRNGNEKK